MVIYHYDAITGCLLGHGIADTNQLSPDSPLLPTYSTTTPAPNVPEYACARYLNTDGTPPPYYADGEWIVCPDWRGIPLWRTSDGQPVEITEPNVTPSDIAATNIIYPGPGYFWDQHSWQLDDTYAERVANLSAIAEQKRRVSIATAQIAIIQPAVEGGYAKPSHTQLLTDWQRYRYELTLVPDQPGWPSEPSWPTSPQTVI